MRNRQEVKKERKSSIPTAGVGGIDDFAGTADTGITKPIREMTQQ